PMVITPTVEPPVCIKYFNYWEKAKEQLGALGMFIVLENGEFLTFFTHEKAALHEVGHFVDLEKGGVSMSDEFHLSVDEYLFNSVIEDERLYNRILGFYEGYQYHQIYADLYAYNFIGEFPLPKMFEGFFK
ncbi:hypothetical protein LCGC14_2742130, partial [marine sediment metagenome]